MKRDVKKSRRPGVTRLSAKNQVTIPKEALLKAGLKSGDRVRVTARGPGEVVLRREDDPVTRYAGSLSGTYPEGHLDELRDEWR